VWEYLGFVSLKVKFPLFDSRMAPLLSKSNLPTGLIPQCKFDGIKHNIVFLP